MRPAPGIGVAMALCLGAATGCTSSSAAEARGPVRFLLEAPGAAAPVWVQLNDALDHPGWVRVARASGEPVFLENRCDIEDCSSPGGVCGMAMPMVLDLAAAGAVEVQWDGRWSAFDTGSGCETREPAPPGAYVATFCWGSEVEGLGEGDPARGVAGRLSEPTCHDVSFTLPDDVEVRHRVPPR